MRTQKLSCPLPVGLQREKSVLYFDVLFRTSGDRTKTANDRVAIKIVRPVCVSFTCAVFPVRFACKILARCHYVARGRQRRSRPILSRRIRVPPSHSPHTWFPLSLDVFAFSSTKPARAVFSTIFDVRYTCTTTVHYKTHCSITTITY